VSAISPPVLTVYSSQLQWTVGGWWIKHPDPPAASSWSISTLILVVDPAIFSAFILVSVWCPKVNRMVEAWQDGLSLAVTSVKDWIHLILFQYCILCIVYLLLFSRLFMEELVNYIHRFPLPEKSAFWKDEHVRKWVAYSCGLIVFIWPWVAISMGIWLTGSLLSN